MSVETYTIKAIRCDVKEDAECKGEDGTTYEAFAGKSVAEARADAYAYGWRRVRNPLGKGARDACPRCVAALEGRWA